MGIEKVSFSEYRNEELYFIIGEKEERSWRFSEKSSSNLIIKGHSIEATPELCQKAEEELNKQYELKEGV